MRRGIRDDDVLAAMRSVPRHLFVPAALVPEAYVDTPLPIGHGQTISQPYMVALMTSLLESTCAAACSRSAPGPATRRRCWPSWPARSTRSSGSRRWRNARARCSPASATTTRTRRSATARWAGARRRRSTRSSCAAAAPEAPPPLLEQLADGGRLVIPLGRPSRDQVLTVLRAGRRQYRGAARHALPVRAARARQAPRASSAAAPHPAPRRRSGRAALQVRRRTMKAVSVARARPRAGRVLPRQRAHGGRAPRPARLGPQRERRHRRPAPAGRPAPSSTPCSTGAGRARRRPA